jgi:hypothetical protein
VCSGQAKGADRVADAFSIGAELEPSVAFPLLRDPAKKGTNLGLTVTAVAAERADRGQLAGFCPTRDRFGVNAKHRRHFGGREQWLCLGCTSACQGNFLLVGPAAAGPPTNGAGGCRFPTEREAARRFSKHGSTAIDPLDQILALVRDVRYGPTGSSFDLRGLVRDTPFSPRLTAHPARASRRPT